MYILWPEQLAYIEMDGVKRVKCWPLGSWTADLAPSTQIIERNALLPKEARERELPILVKKSHFEDAWARDFCRQSLLDTKQQDAKSWLNIIKSRSYSLSRHTMISCYSSRVESDAMRDAFFPQKLQESRDYYLTFVILGKFRTFISHWLEKINASLNWFQITKRAESFEISRRFSFLLPL